nr:RNA-directed DNA polymerase, eukaryota, reverse transcriptase zinc-binding domain protein [Tanacetum cinerariifolium]
MRKLDCFLISNNVLLGHFNMQVTVLDKVWSDHNPILLHCKKTDFGPIPFKLFHSWFNRKDFDDTVKETWTGVSITDVGTTLALHEKVKRLKTQIKLWYSRIKTTESGRKKTILAPLGFLDEKIDTGLNIILKDGLSANMFLGVNIGSPGVLTLEVETMAVGIGCSPTFLFFSYLGLPIGSNMGRILSWNTLIEHFKAKLLSHPVIGENTGMRQE